MSNSTEGIDSYPGLNRAGVFRKFAEEATKNSHNTIKQVWAILFTGGTFALLHSFDQWILSFTNLFFNGTEDAIAPQNFSESHRIGYSLLFISLALFVVYLLTFYRFYVGNIRVFDMKYDEVFKFISNLHDEKNWDEKRKNPDKEEDDYRDLFGYATSLSKFETFQLMTTTLIVAYLTVTPMDPPKFLTVYFFLLVFDLLWMFWPRHESSHFFRKHFSKIFKKDFANVKESLLPKFPEYAITRWRYNNVACMAALGFALWVYFFVPMGGTSTLSQDWDKVDFLALATVVALMNCLIDLWLTWDFYNPKFGDAYKRVARPPAAGDVGPQKS